MLSRLWPATILLLCGASAAAAYQNQNPLPPEPLGKLIDVGGYRVHLYCTGQGSPTVVITGTEFSFDWALVQPGVATFARICTYDPSGTAWSDPRPPLTCLARVAELHKVLQKGNVAPPYVLAGLSMGAIVARLYAGQYPDQVSGMVFVDHAFLDVGLTDENSAPTPISGVDTPPMLIHKEPISVTIEDNPILTGFPNVIAPYTVGPFPRIP